jgi:CHAT domain-containing protein
VSSRGEEWKYLPGTLIEVKGIQQALKPAAWNARVFSGANASEEKLKSLTGSNAPDVLHIATHGFFSDATTGNPLLQTGILLAGGNRSWQGNEPGNGMDDGILTAAEVSYLDFSKTSLVVLSACETGLGKIESNEGVFGLQRAFALSGVDRIMMSMWKVSDQETAIFMQQFYGFLSEGHSLHAAYLLAQKAMSARYSPYFWAAFVLQE